MNRLVKAWLSVRGSGWFIPGAPGSLFPFPLAWQAWAITGGFVVALLGTILLSPDAGWAARIAMCVGYIALGMATYA